MTLIKCPECGKGISDKSKQCINCGYPLNNNQENKLYKMIFLRMNKGGNIFLTKSILEQIYNIPKGTAYDLLKKEGSTLIDGIKPENMEYLYDTFLSYGCVVEFKESICTKENSHNSEWSESRNKRSSPVTCPKCGSTNIQILRKKFSLLTGFATNKVERVCVNCKHTW